MFLKGAKRRKRDPRAWSAQASLAVFKLVQDLSFEYWRSLAFAKNTTVLQSIRTRFLCVSWLGPRPSQLLRDRNLELKIYCLEKSTQSTRLLSHHFIYFISLLLFILQLHHIIIQFHNSIIYDTITPVNLFFSANRPIQTLLVSYWKAAPINARSC